MSQNVTFLSLRSLIQIYYFKNGPDVTITSKIISTPNFIALFYFNNYFNYSNNSRKWDFWLLSNVNIMSNIFDHVHIYFTSKLNEIYIVYKYLRTKIFSRNTNILLQIR